MKNLLLLSLALSTPAFAKLEIFNQTPPDHVILRDTNSDLRIATTRVMADFLGSYDSRSCIAASGILLVNDASRAVTNDPKKMIWYCAYSSQYVELIAND